MKHGEKLAAFAAGLLFLLVLVWALFSDGVVDEFQQHSEAEPSSFEIKSSMVEELSHTIDWERATSQGGPNWVFDIFTPPVIYYNEETGTFTVTAPFPDAGPVDQAFELELMEIAPVPFRFQLVSYAGAKGNYMLTLENLDSGKDVFCGTREVLRELELEVIDFVERRVVALSSKPGTTEAFDRVGAVTVKDQRDGNQYTLLHNKTTYQKNPDAHFVSSMGVRLRLTTGDTWSSGSTTYTVKSIDLATQSVSVEKTSTEADDKVLKFLHPSNRINTSILSNRNTRTSEPPPGAF